MVGMVSSPWSASVCVEVTALLVFVTPEHTLVVLTVLRVLFFVCPKKRFGLNYCRGCALSAAVHSRGNSLMYTIHTDIHCVCGSVGA